MPPRTRFISPYADGTRTQAAPASINRYLAGSNLDCRRLVQRPTCRSPGGERTRTSRPAAIGWSS